MQDNGPLTNVFRGSHPKRVLILHSIYRTRGGEEAAIEQQKKSFLDAGVECQVLFRGPADESMTLLKKASLAKGLFRNRSDDEELQACLNDFDPGVVHVHNLLPHFGVHTLDMLHAWALRKGRIVVSTIHNHRWYCANGLGFRANNFCDLCAKRKNPLWGGVLRCRGSAMESFAYATAISISFAKKYFCNPNHRTIALNERMGRRITKAFPGASLTVLPNPLQKFSGELDEREFKKRFPALIAWKGPQFAVIGRLSPEKGIQKLIQKILTATSDSPEPFNDPNVRFVFAGDGPLHEEVLLAQKNSPRILSLGRIPESDVRNLLQYTKKFFFSSIVEEQCPTVLRQACGMGIEIYSFKGLFSHADIIKTWGPLLDESTWRKKVLEIYRF